MVGGDSELLARFDDRPWANGPIEVWRGRSHPGGLPITAAVALVMAPGHLLLVDVRSRGWDLPADAAGRIWFPFLSTL